ncbi:bifunctional tRNA (5-methylaminomethyl-2-thiouridine)(34)-methyltransferase MnmD/FAD-dependent 5-carboxymethylaminomethyl-2-thiouridine(34) oxidoreductase MnmC [Craterilacuibacter sp.]|uniref:bifunctional tRNA (5-methylaminomethyl-2-thiouridine)(34)-methyltransferase MnmD/FAD-dependent 5-carboxymethylaminomethyl-2-thiouridine(34) oxidoreductase MnmC n=1 Tax=Craterilacuibacter sp. TaxID=2870909 RepID=UPI003F3B622D
MSTPLLHARLSWQDGQPSSLDYGDVYFARDSGLDETRYVFLDGNRLAGRFANLAAGETFTVGETGFGTGLNFLCTWQLFKTQAPASARLAFVSVEKHPLSPADLSRALAAWPSLAREAAQLVDAYHGIEAGYQHLLLDKGRVSLTLLIGDALETLPELDAQVNAWFLDGFAPVKNPEMWQAPLFKQLARLSAPDATLATFTSAGFVRRELAIAGFSIKKTPGFGRKWAMTVGTRNATETRAWQAPWLARPPACHGRRAIVIGAGIAGAAAAASLASRGFDVTVLERHAAPALEASGNPQGVLYLKLSAHSTPQTRLLLAGYGYSLRTLATRQNRGTDWDDCGVLQLAHDEATRQRQSQLAAAFPASLLYAVGAAQASELAGLPVEQDGLFFPEGGWIKPPHLVAALLASKGITCRYGASVQKLAQSAQGWQAGLENGETLPADIVVIACANASTLFTQSAHLPLKPVRGQVSVAAASTASRQLKTVLCGAGYIAPAADDGHTFGASFNYERSDSEVSAAEHTENLAMLAGLNPALYQALEGDKLTPASLKGRAALRTTTPDYLPLVGMLADQQGFTTAYADLARDASLKLGTIMPWLDGLYISSGHGSRGMVTAPLAGELIASLACKEPLPLPKAVVDALSPNRFLLRTLIRTKPGKKPQRA